MTDYAKEREQLQTWLAELSLKEREEAATIALAQVSVLAEDPAAWLAQMRTHEGRVTADDNYRSFDNGWCCRKTLDTDEFTCYAQLSFKTMKYSGVSWEFCIRRRKTSDESYGEKVCYYNWRVDADKTIESWTQALPLFEQEFALCCDLILEEVFEAKAH